MDLFRELGRQVEEFKTKAENAAEERATEQCEACGTEFDAHHDQCPDCGAAQSDRAGDGSDGETSGDGSDNESA